MPFHFIKGQCHGCSNPTTESQIEIFNMKISQNDPFWIMSFVITNRCEICMRLNVNNRRQNNSPKHIFSSAYLSLWRFYIAISVVYDKTTFIPIPVHTINAIRYVCKCLSVYILYGALFSNSYANITNLFLDII